jgi:MFS family permease
VLSIGGGLVIGLAVGPMNVVGMTIIQERVPQGMLGRVTGALIAISQLAVPVSVLLAGFGVETFGVRAPLAVAAGIFTIVAIYSFIDPIMRQVDRPVAVEVDDLAVAAGRPDANGVAS